MQQVVSRPEHERAYAQHAIHARIAQNHPENSQPKIDDAEDKTEEFRC
jgi:hypothetical protein